MTAAAAKPAPCPRCQGRMVRDGTEGDVSCFTCGFVIYTGAVPTGAPNPDGGRAFLKALKAPAGVAAIKEAGLEPISGH